MKSYFMKMSRLRRTTLLAAFAMGVAILLLFVCIYGVSNATALVILASAAVLGFFSMATVSRWTFLILVPLTAGLAAELVIREHASGLAMFSVLARFVGTGLLIVYFATLLTRESHRLYLDMERLAREREDALADSRRWISRLNALVVVTSTISTKNHLNDIFTEGLAEARKVFNADSGLIYSVGQETGDMSIVGSFGYSDEVLEKMQRRWAGHVSSCDACTRVKPISVDNLATDDKCPNLARVETGSAICVPITSGGNLWGVLHLRRRFPDAFTPEDGMLAQAMTYQFALAMQRASLFEQVNRLAITDPLTGLYNYRKMVRDIKREIVRSRRYKHSFSFIMSDLDFFKRTNDEHGHTAGDAVLREVARTLNTGRREVDRVYRYGGEEFAVLLPETDWPEALEVAEKLRGRVESLRVQVEGVDEPLTITISMGVASFSQDSLELNELVEAADEALYKAKDEGRNRVVTHAGMLRGLPNREAG